MPLGVVIVNRVLPELFTHADEDVFDALREPAAGRACCTQRGRSGRDRGARRRAPRGLDAPRAGRCTSPDLREEVDLPLLLLPYLFVRDHGLRVTRMVAEALGQELGVTDGRVREAQLARRAARRTREVVVFCGSGGVGKTSVAAAAALTAAARPRRQGARAHHRPRPAAGRRARARGVRQRRTPGAARRVHRARRRAARRAVGGDARHQALVGRAGAAARARRGDRLPHPRQPDVPQRHQPLRAEPRLHRDGAAVRAARQRRVRPHHHRHAAHPERDRLPRGAGAHGRVLRRAAAALAHHAVPHRRWARRAHVQRRQPALLPDGRPRAREPVPPGHRRVLPQLPVDVRRVRRARRSRSSSCCTTGAPRSRSSPRSRARRSARPRRSAASSPRAASTSARSCSTRCCPSTSCRPTASTRPTCSRARQRRDRGRSSRRRATPGSTTPTSTARVLRTLADSFRNYEVVARREAELRTELSGSRHRARRSS